MYDYIKGKLTEKTATYIVVEAGGVGYNLAVSLYTYTKLKDESEARVFTYLAIKEDAPFVLVLLMMRNERCLNF